MDALNLIARSSTKTCIMLIRIFASEDDDVIKKRLKQHHPVRLELKLQGSSDTPNVPPPAVASQSDAVEAVKGGSSPDPRGRGELE